MQGGYLVLTVSSKSRTECRPTIRNEDRGIMSKILLFLSGKSSGNLKFPIKNEIEHVAAAKGK
jgi:hypothetical protein